MMSFFTLQYFRDDRDRRSGLQNLDQKAASHEFMSKVRLNEKNEEW